MSRKTEEEYKLYNNYLSRNTGISAVPAKADTTPRLTIVEMPLADSTTNQISAGLNDIEMKLLEAFPNLSTIADVLEDTIILVGPDGKELPDNLDARRIILNKLQSAFEKDNALFAKIRETYPSFGLDIISKLTPDEYAVYMSEVSKIKKVCGTVNAVPVSKTDDSNDSTTYSTMLEDIAECIDTASFQEASLIEKKFIRAEINAFKDALSRDGSENSDDDDSRKSLLHTIAEIDILAEKNKQSLELLEKYSSYFNTHNINIDHSAEARRDKERDR